MDRSCACLFFFLLKISAPYGKFARPGFGPVIGRIKGWILMESPAVLSVSIFFIISDRHSNPVATAFLVMWLVHYLYRTCVFPFIMRGPKKNMALTIVILGAVFNIGNGYLIGRYLFTLSLPKTQDWLMDPRFIIGALLFLAGFTANIHSDAILRALRKPGETGYKIPKGGVFRFVSAANYFSETVEWIGFAIATWSIAGVIFAIWTIANLAPRAISQHKWYKENFPDYPGERKAIIPFVL